MAENMQATYDTFVEKAAQGRNTTPERIDAIGQGRVWTGRQAKEIGLIDELGGLDRAVALAKLPAEAILLRPAPRPARQRQQRVDAGVSSRVHPSANHAGARGAAPGLPPRRAARADAKCLR